MGIFKRSQSLKIKQKTITVDRQTFMATGMNTSLGLVITDRIPRGENKRFKRYFSFLGSATGFIQPKLNSL